MPFHLSPAAPKTAAPDMVGPGLGPPVPALEFSVKFTLINWAWRVPAASKTTAWTNAMQIRAGFRPNLGAQHWRARRGQRTAGLGIGAEIRMGLKFEMGFGLGATRENAPAASRARCNA